MNAPVPDEPISAEPVLIVGTGQAAFQLAAFLRNEGFARPIELIGEERHRPYQRPPLSKLFMNGGCKTEQLFFQPVEWYADRGISLRLGTRVARIDRMRREIETADGNRISYGRLVLATGASNRRLSALEGALDLRDLDDAVAIRTRMRLARDIVVVGGGFLGLEFAAAAVTAGARVTVIEAMPALMAQSVSGPVGETFRCHLEALGVSFLLGTSVRGIAPQDGGRQAVLLEGGDERIADLVVASVGVVPNDGLAREAGLETHNGVVVDVRLLTSDPTIAAIGDCAAFPTRFAPARCRIESVQNAIDQARCLAHTLAGQPKAYDAVPWFWSEQGGLRLQIAGLGGGAEEVVLRGDITARRFSAYRFREGRLVAVESVASPADHMLARRLLAAGAAVTPAHVVDPAIDLKAFVTPSVSAAA